MSPTHLPLCLLVICSTSLYTALGRQLQHSPLIILSNQVYLLAFVFGVVSIDLIWTNQCGVQCQHWLGTSQGSAELDLIFICGGCTDNRWHLPFIIGTVRPAGLMDRLAWRLHGDLFNSPHLYRSLSCSGYWNPSWTALWVFTPRMLCFQPHWPMYPDKHMCQYIYLSINLWIYKSINL